MARIRSTVGRAASFLLLASLAMLALSRPGAADQTFDVNVPSVHVTGDFRLNGQPFPASFLQGANFFLRDAKTGDEVYLGLSNDQSFDRRIVPGHYDVVYEHKVGSQVPQNPEAVVMSHVALLADMDFDIEVSSIALSGSFTHDGAAFPASVYENALISLRDARTGALTPLAETRLGGYAIALVAGRYDVVYELLAGGIVIPQNARTRFLQDVALLASQDYDIDVPSVNVSGAFSINGAPPPVSAYDYGRIRLVEIESGVPFAIGRTSDLTYDEIVIPGTYDFLYELAAGGTIVPSNRSARVLEDVDLSADGVVDLDIPSIHVYGAIQLNGSVPPASVYESGYLNLRAGEDSVTLGRSSDGAYSAHILPGVYDVEWELIAGVSVPRNSRGRVAVRTFGGPTLYDIDVRTAQLTVDVTVNGAPFDLSNGGTAVFELEDRRTGEAVALPATLAGDAAGVYVLGNYRLVYSHDGAPELPTNQRAVIGGDFSLLANQTRPADLSTVSLGGVFALDGAPFPASVAQSGAIELVSTYLADEAFLGGSQTGSYSALVLPGIYRARWDWHAGATVPRNQAAQLAGSVTVPEPAGTVPATALTLAVLAVSRGRAGSRRPRA